MKARSKARLGLRFGLPLVAFASAAPAWGAAPQRDPAAAEALFVAGREAVLRGDYAAACPKFAESDRLDPAPGTLMNLADCEEHVHHPAAAWSRWKEALEQLPPDDPRLPLARERAAAIEKLVPRLTLRLAKTKASATVTRDGAEVGPGALGIALPVEPGEHAIVVTAPGYEERRYTVSLREGESAEQPIDAGAKLPDPPGDRRPLAAPSPGGTRRTVGYVLGGVGLAALAAGGVTGLLAVAKKGDLDGNCYPKTVCNDAGADAAKSGRTFATVSTVAFITDGVALTAGTVLVLTSRGGEHRIEAWLAPRVDPRGGGAAMVGGTFE